MQAVMNGWPESRKYCHQLPLDYWTYREEGSARNGLLFKGHRLIIPEKLHNRTLQTINEHHLGVKKMQKKTKESVFWPEITAYILQAAWSCKVCQMFSGSQQREIMFQHEVPQGLWEKIGAAFFEFESTNYLLIADYYSQFPIIRRMRSTMTNVTTHVKKHVFSEYSVSKTVMSDRAPQFSSKRFKAFADQYCSFHITSCPRYPQSNGMIEKC